MSLSMEDHTVYKELSLDMLMFVTHLYNEGNKFDITSFENSYARDFVKYADEQFGRDHLEITNKKLNELFVDEEDNESVELRKSTPLSMESHTVYKELPLDKLMFVTHLYNEG
ncbi:hypothetical protein H5410_062473 [Solanum commersonii]|uniref:Uncharacterized protein n=1 Tax=Solanum commersonii TaxID=4109 RepID=A0A9J5WAG9_SOLCO|nr:hypothetical protein H5410_062473 [Solanum commersonii]